MPCADGWAGSQPFCCALVTANAAGPGDCDAAPDVKCLAAEVFALAKTLPDNDFYRPHVVFAEKELAPSDIVTALDCVGTEILILLHGRTSIGSPRPDVSTSPIKRARQLKSPGERVGALLAVAVSLVDRKDTTRAQKIVEEAEHQLRFGLGRRRGDVEYFASARRGALASAWTNRRAARPITSTGITALLLSLPRNIRRRRRSYERRRGATLSAIKSPRPGSTWPRMRSSAATSPRLRARRRTPAARLQRGRRRINIHSDLAGAHPVDGGIAGAGGRTHQALAAMGQRATMRSARRASSLISCRFWLVLGGIRTCFRPLAS